jgi:DNA-directed RNA polymerase subunit RPC12/RpoP
MPEETARTIRIPVAGEEGKHEGHQIRTIMVSRGQGVKALYCIACKKIITYLFAKNKDWTMSTAKDWVSEHTKRLVETKEIIIDQEKEFIKLAVTYTDGETAVYEPNSPSFILKEYKIYNETLDDSEHIVRVKKKEDFIDDVFKRKELSDNVYGIYGMIDKEKSDSALMEYRLDSKAFTVEEVKQWVKDNNVSFILFEEAKAMEDDKRKKKDESKITCKGCNKEFDWGKEPEVSQGLVKCPSCGAKVDQEGTVAKEKEQQYDVSQDTLEIVKFDKQKKLVYGVFLVPEKADHDGDVISAEDIEKVAHRFMADYRNIDEMHKDIIEADIVESAIAWADDMDFHGKTLTKGTWFGAVKVHDQAVWDKIVSGEYKGFSVRISGVREPIKKED